MFPKLAARHGLSLAVALILALPYPAGAATSIDPALKWRTAASERFRVHYAEGLDARAQDVARYAEAAYADLRPYLQSQPQLPIEIVLWDNVDSPYGFAFPYPRNVIKLHLAPTGEDYLAGRYEDYLRQLVAHELTHILQFEVQGAPSALVNRLFGRAAYPTLLLPLFLTEGLATLVENGHHRGGEHPLGDFGSRGDFPMMLRSAALEGRLLSLDQVGTYGLSQWPAHRTPYLYGSAFFRFLVERYGPESPKRLFSRYAELPVVGLNWAASHAAEGLDLYALWSAFTAFLEESAERQRRTVMERPLTASQALTTSGMANRRPTWLPDGRLLYSRSDRHEPASLRLRDLGSGSESLLVDLRAIGTFNLNKELIVDSPFGNGSLTADGRYYWFSALNEVGRFNVLRDLYRFDMATRHVRKLSDGGRYADPAVSPDGTRVVAVASAQGSQSLVVLDAEGRLVRRFGSEAGYPQFSSLRWSPDGSRVLLSAWRDGSRDLYLLDPDSGALRALWRDLALDVMPTWSPDGRYVVYSSDHTGVFNLYAYRLSDGQRFQLTNVLGGAFDPAVSPDGQRLAFASYASRGYDIHVMPFAPERGMRVEEGPSRVFRSDGTLQALKPVAPEPPLPWSPVPTTSYQPLATMGPQVWMPSASFDERGLRVGGTTWGSDALGQHEWSASAGLGLASARPHYALSYRNDQFLPRMTFSIADDASAREASLPTAGRVQLWQRQQVAEASVRLPLDPRLGLTTMGSSLSGGLRWRATERFGARVQGTFLPADQWSPALASELARGETFWPEGGSSSLFLTWRHARTYRSAFGVSSEEGEALSLSYERGLAGASIDRWLGEARHYVPMPWAHHVLALRGVAGWNAGGGWGDFSLGGMGSAQLSRTVGQDALGMLSQVPLRGFAGGHARGGRLLSVGMEYRYPLLELDRGYFGEAPFLLQRLSAAVGYEAGTVGSGWLHGLGAELRLQGEFPMLPSELRLGLSRGLGPMGLLQPYMGLGLYF